MMKNSDLKQASWAWRVPRRRPTGRRRHCCWRRRSPGRAPPCGGLTWARCAASQTGAAQQLHKAHVQYEMDGSYLMVFVLAGGVHLKLQPMHVARLKPTHVAVEVHLQRLVLAGCSRCARAMVWAQPGRRGGCPAARASAPRPRRRLLVWQTAALLAQRSLSGPTTQTERAPQSLTTAWRKTPLCQQSC